MRDEKTKETIVSIYVVVQSTQENTHTKFISLKLWHMFPWVTKNFSIKIRFLEQILNYTLQVFYQDAANMSIWKPPVSSTNLKTTQVWLKKRFSLQKLKLVHKLTIRPSLPHYLLVTSLIALTLIKTIQYRINPRKLSS